MGERRALLLCGILLVGGCATAPPPPPLPADHPASPEAAETPQPLGEDYRFLAPPDSEKGDRS